MKVSEKGAVSVYGMGRFSGDLVQGTMAEALGHGGRHSRVHCRERSAAKGEGLT
jgi:hypothetical protein